MKAKIFTASLTCLLLASPVMYADDNPCAALMKYNTNIYLKSATRYNGQPVTVIIQKVVPLIPLITFELPYHQPMSMNPRASCEKVTDDQYNYTWNEGDVGQCPWSNSGSLMISVNPDEAPSRQYSGHLTYHYCLPPTEGSNKWLYDTIKTDLKTGR